MGQLYAANGRTAREVNSEWRTALDAAPSLLLRAVHLHLLCQ
jgi:hypothetical protein